MASGKGSNWLIYSLFFCSSFRDFYYLFIRRTKISKYKMISWKTLEFNIVQSDGDVTIHINKLGKEILQKKSTIWIWMDNNVEKFWQKIYSCKKMKSYYSAINFWFNKYVYNKKCNVITDGVSFSISFPFLSVWFVLLLLHISFGTTKECQSYR